MSDRPHESLGAPVHFADWLVRSKNLGIMLVVLTCCWVAYYSVKHNQPVPAGVATILGGVLTLNTAYGGVKLYRAGRETPSAPGAGTPPPDGRDTV